LFSSPEFGRIWGCDKVDVQALIAIFPVPRVPETLTLPPITRGILPPPPKHLRMVFEGRMSMYTVYAVKFVDSSMVIVA
jgi:hypothetical protein